MRRELRRMVGYTIVASASLREWRESRGSKVAILDDGSVFEVSSLSLALPLSDVVVFAKRYPRDMIDKYPGLPDRSYYAYKLLIDDEIFDGTLVTLRRAAPRLPVWQIVPETFRRTPKPQRPPIASDTTPL